MLRLQANFTFEPDKKGDSAKPVAAFKAVAAILDSVSQKPGGYAEDRFPEPGSGSILMPWQLDRELGLATVLVCWLDQ
jgi:hypothetical protein